MSSDMHEQAKQIANAGSEVLIMIEIDKNSIK